MEKLLYSRKEAAEQLSISLATVDELIVRGDLKPRRMGRRVLVHYKELERLASRDVMEIWPEKQGGKTVRGAA